MSSPGERSAEGSGNVVPLDPRSAGQSTGFLLQNERLGTRKDAGSEEQQRDDSKNAGWHLGHDGSKDLGRRVLGLPSHVLRLPESSGWQKGNRVGADLSDRSKGRSSSDKQRQKEEAELGHDGVDSVQM